jgi:hypothetical protein
VRIARRIEDAPVLCLQPGLFRGREGSKGEHEAQGGRCSHGYHLSPREAEGWVGVRVQSRQLCSLHERYLDPQKRSFFASPQKKRVGRGEIVPISAEGHIAVS